MDEHEGRINLSRGRLYMTQRNSQLKFPWQEKE